MTTGVPINDLLSTRPVKAPPRLERVAFRTSRLAEFCGTKELTAQTGYEPGEWPLVLAKELIDNALDACEEAAIAPEISIEVSTERSEIVIADNGPGLPVETLRNVLDYSIRVSSREAYVSPSRGQQGNALKCVIAMPFALDGTRGATVVESQGQAHRIVFEMDPVGASLGSYAISRRRMYKPAPASPCIGPRRQAICSRRQRTDLYKQSATS